MSVQSINIPIRFIRQYPGSLDVDEYFESTAARNAYLSSPRRWAGMEVADAETGKRYVLNATKDAWKRVYTQDDFDINDYVAKAGDIMTGSLLMSGGAALDSTLTAGVDTLNLGTANADIINIGYAGSIVNINGTTIFQNTENVVVKDKLIRLNVGGSLGSAVSSGFEIEEASVVAAWFATDATRKGWDFKAPNSFQFTLALNLLTANRDIRVPDADGIFALTSDLDSYVPVARTITINGTTQDLSTNRSWNVGTVTSVGLDVPTGFTAGSPITDSGQLTLDFALGYSLPSDVEQANWNEAFSWGNHASAGYILLSRYIVDEIPSGTIDGINRIFTLTNNPLTTKLMVFLNGIKLEKGASSDYTVSGNTITFSEQLIPRSGDKISATYIF